MVGAGEEPPIGWSATWTGPELGGLPAQDAYACACVGCVCRCPAATRSVRPIVATGVSGSRGGDGSAPFLFMSVSREMEGSPVEAVETDGKV